MVLSGRPTAFSAELHFAIRFNDFTALHILLVFFWIKSYQSFTYTILSVLDGTLKFAKSVTLSHIPWDQALTNSAYRLC